MKRVIGFALIWIAVGMILAMLLPHTALIIILILLFLAAGYHLFCC